MFGNIYVATINKYYPECCFVVWNRNIHSQQIIKKFIDRNPFVTWIQTTCISNVNLTNHSKCDGARDGHWTQTTRIEVTKRRIHRSFSTKVSLFKTVRTREKQNSSNQRTDRNIGSGKNERSIKSIATFHIQNFALVTSPLFRERNFIYCYFVSMSMGTHITDLPQTTKRIVLKCEEH